MRLSQCLNQPGLEINILHIPDLYVLMVLPFVIIVLIYKQPCLLNILKAKRYVSKKDMLRNVT